MKSLTYSIVAALLASILVSTSQAAYDSFLRIPNIPGEATADGHVGDIDLISFKSGILQAISAAGNGSGLTAGKPQFQPLRVYKYVDKASTLLFIDCALGKHLSTITLYVNGSSSYATGNASIAAAPTYPATDFFVIELTDVVIASINDDNDASDGGNLVETVTFQYSRIKWTYTPVGTDGQLGTPIIRGWNLMTNKPL